MIFRCIKFSLFSIVKACFDLLIANAYVLISEKLIVFTFTNEYHINELFFET